SIKAMYVVGENPALSFPHLSLVREALASLEFLVVQDMFLTETAKLATVVLPAASFAEKEGTCTSIDGLVQRLHQAIEPPGASLADWRIFVELAKRMGRPMDYSSPGQVMREISEFVPLYRGIDYARLEERGIYCTGPRPGLEGKAAEGERASTPPPSFTPIEYVPPEDGAHDDYPLSLMVGSVLYHFGSGTRSLRSASLSSMAPEGFVEVNREDGERLKVSEGETVRVVSPVGEVTVTARVTDMVPAGTLWMPSCFPRSPAHGLFPISLDEKTKTPSLKTCPVRLERVGQDG
ncbi:MAG: molybdopterin-dependent oxidoreductase, partial [Chloroflexota bacterium]